MGAQQSQKRGVRSEAQKEAETREGYAPTSASSHVAGAFGKEKDKASAKEGAKDARYRKERQG